MAVAQAFKGTLAVGLVADALLAGVTSAGARGVAVKGSDGGDGLLDALGPARRSTHAVTGPLGSPVAAQIGWLDDGTAVVESRMACGLALIPHAERDPLRATTRGVGELVVLAARAGAETVLVGLGGSASMDGGLGAARSWGWTATDPAGGALPEGGGALPELGALRAGPSLGVRLLGLADVRNRLLGTEGAAIYAPQKGAGPADIARLERGLARLVELSEPWSGPSLAAREGAGAAGGLGFGLLCFGNGDLVPGAAWVLDRNGFDPLLDDAALVLVAEARVDATSFAGKLTGEVVQRARRRGVPVAVITPEAVDVVPGLECFTAPGRWSAADLARHSECLVRAALGLPPS